VGRLLNRMRQSRQVYPPRSDAVKTGVVSETLGDRVWVVSAADRIPRAELIVRVASPHETGTVRCTQRLGGLLNFYHRAA
jgi:hypothetical protein